MHGLGDLADGFDIGRTRRELGIAQCHETLILHRIGFLHCRMRFEEVEQLLIACTILIVEQDEELRVACRDSFP